MGQQSTRMSTPPTSEADTSTMSGRPDMSTQSTSSTSPTPSTPPPSVRSNNTVKDLDLERYMGRWYEIAKYDNPWEKDCNHVTADYTLLSDGTVRVINSCYDIAGDLLSRGRGIATVPDPDNTGALIVKFSDSPPGEYNVYWTDYNYAIVGGQYLWILSRYPDIVDRHLVELLEIVADIGYDPDKLIAIHDDVVIHSG